MYVYIQGAQGILPQDTSDFASIDKAQAPRLKAFCLAVF